MVRRSDRIRWTDILDKPDIPTPGEAGDTAALEAALAAEEQARKAADSVLAGKVTSEASARAAADSVETAARIAADATKQPLDSDLTAIAALSTTAFGRALLELTDATALAGLGWSYRETAVSDTVLVSDVTVVATAALTLSLPAASAVDAGRPLMFVADVDGVVLDCDGADTIAGDATFTLYANESLQLFSDGVSTWRAA